LDWPKPGSLIKVFKANWVGTFKGLRPFIGWVHLGLIWLAK